MDLEILFSPARLSGYTNTIEHENNFFVISQIAHKIGILKCLLRNRINLIMTKNFGNEWIYNLPSEICVKGDLQNDSFDRLISAQSLGFWLKIANFYRIQNQIFSQNFLDDLDFKRYFQGNTNKFDNRARLRDYQKVDLLLHLFRNLRNRAFHFENLYKMVGDKPRLNGVINNGKHKASASLQTDKITLFLDDLIADFDKELVNYASKKK